MGPKVLCKMKIDFAPMREPHLGYKEQNHIDPHRVKMASAAMVHFGVDPGKFILFLAGEYTIHHQDVRCTLNAVQNYVTPDDYEHMKWILLNGCPPQLTFKEPTSNKLEFISRCNFKSFVDNPQLVWKTMNKEDHYSHLVPMDQL
jgi:hypothetical protein